MKKGLYINEKTFVSFEQLNRAAMGNQYATRKVAMDLSAMFGYLPNPDTVLRNLGRSIEVYNDLIVDSHVGAVTEARKDSVLSMEWDINRDEAQSKKAKFYKDLFDDLDMHRIMTELLDAPLYGYQVMEVLWKNVGEYWLPVDVVGKPQHWFVFDDENQLKMKTKSKPLGEDLPEKKFLLATHNATYMNPYGFPVLSRCFWPVTFKKGGMKFWVVFTEKYGMPWAIGKHPRNADQSEVNDLADALEQMIQDAVAAIPDDSSVEIIESSSKGGSLNIYQSLAEFCNSEISKGVLGNTLTTEDSRVRAAGRRPETHMVKEVKKAETDKKVVVRAINQLIEWIEFFNFASGEQPKFEMYEEADVDKPRADRDKTLSETGQVKFTKVYFTRNYDFADDEIEVVESKEHTPDPPAGRPSPLKRGIKDSEFAQGSNPQQIIDELLSSLSPDKMQEQAVQALQPVMDLVQSAPTYEFAMEKLIEMFPEMNTADLEETMQKIYFISEIWGRLSEHESR